MQLSILSSFFLSKLFLAIDLLNLDYDVGTALGIGEFAGGILIALLMVFTFCSLPIWKKMDRLALIFAILVMGFCVAVQWLNIFFIIVIVCFVALGIADKIMNLGVLRG